MLFRSDLLTDYDLTPAKAAAAIIENNVVMNSKIYSNMYSVWDEYPQIVATDRYFALQDALNGYITEERLLSTATASDREDGNVTTDLKILDFDQNVVKQFTHAGTFTITYEIIDSVGNVTDKRVTVHLIDAATIKYVPILYSTRFISSEFFDAAYEDGGFRDTSFWRNNEEYRNALAEVLSNKRVNMDQTDDAFLGRNLDIPGTGNFVIAPQETISLTHEEVLNAQQYVIDNAIGNLVNSNGLSNFRSQFMN